MDTINSINTMDIDIQNIIALARKENRMRKGTEYYEKNKIMLLTSKKSNEYQILINNGWGQWDDNFIRNQENIYKTEHWPKEHPVELYFYK